MFPNEVGYWVQGGQGIANNINQLWGDWFEVEGANDFAQGNTLVHIEADGSLGTGFGGPNASTGYTFYGRYFTALGGFTGADNREPLGTTWGARYDPQNLAIPFPAGHRCAASGCRLADCGSGYRSIAATGTRGCVPSRRIAPGTHGRVGAGRPAGSTSCPTSGSPPGVC